MKFSATHISGHGRGRQMGFPTLNLRPDHPSDLAHGVYVVRVFVEETLVLNGVMHVGPRPTFHEDDVSIEVHVLDEFTELAPDSLVVEVVEKIREVMSFDSPEALVAQIEKDVEKAWEVLDSPSILQ